MVKDSEFTDEDEAKFNRWMDKRKERKNVMDEDEAKFNRWMDKRDLEKESRQSAGSNGGLDDGFQSGETSAFQPKRGPGWGKIIAGGVLIVIVIITFPYLFHYQAIQLSNQETCNGFLGELGQGMDSEMEQQCNTSTGILTVINLLFVVVSILGIIGLILLILGALKR